MSICYSEKRKTNMIFRNAMITPDGTIIESKNRHDYVEHLDENGDTYMIDGGHAYFRRSLNEVPAKDISIESIADDHEFNRQHFNWGTYGKDGDQPFKLVALKDMSLDHLNTILEGQQLIARETMDFFEKEIKYRDEHK